MIDSLRWKIYYDDKPAYSGDPYLAPGRGVQIIVQHDPDNGKYLCFNHDYYWYLSDDDRWEGGNLFGMYDYLLTPGPDKRVIFGRIISNDRFQEIFNRAYNDSDFPPKTGNSLIERRNP